MSDFMIFIVRLHVMQCMVIAKAYLSVHLSVSLLDKRVHCDKMKETYAYILIPHEIPFIIVF